MPLDYLPILIFISAAVFFALLALIPPYFLGPRNPIPTKLEAYESGKLPYGDARRQVPIHYYKAAMLFMMFDIEVVFFLPWVINVKGLGWYGLIVMGIFLAIFILGFIYEWKKGALEWA